MRLAGAIVFLGVIVALAWGQESPYTTKYDNVDVDKILKNDRVLSNYIKCLMEEGPCTPEGRELKKTLPDALASGCTKCNEKQRTNTEKVIRHLMNRRAKDWERLSKKYDPEGVYKAKYDPFAKTA
ncbi:ejaculatory bulb-specific protein 3-like [Sitophilus oryzae]|uniref:Ejaculatory bulb-specific protein 3-like n=1 Tax=Sitophilus oryzae TaxID=7048 RepID=A0A6J2XEL6_SITOR|nr:ejaculatory bulb-specific protein 3-like [Sitophilus oryzae]